MQYTHILITAGISAISERNILGRLLRSEPGPFRFSEGKQNPELAGGSTEAEAIEHVRRLARGNECEEAALGLPTFVSAEYSLLNALKQRDKLHSAAKVVLLHTNTLSGKVAAAALAPLMESHFSCGCSTRPVADFDTSNPERMQRGLGAFMHQVVNELRGLDSSYACFAPQGGYKVMTSLGYVAGSFLGFPTAYLHEDNQTLHVIPPIPVALSPGEQADLGRLARQVERQPELSRLSDEERESVFAHPWLFEVQDDVVVPNAFAEFLGLETQPVLLSPAADETLQKVHNARAIRRRLLALPAQVAQFNRHSGDFAGILDHEREFANLNRAQNRPIFHIWKAAGGEFYIAWKQREDGALLINRIWGAGHTYTKDAEQAHPGNSQGLFDHPADILWTALDQEAIDGAKIDEPPERATPANRPPVATLESADETIRDLRKKLGERNRENAQVTQRNGELRRTADSQNQKLQEFGHDKKLLIQKVASLEKQLSEARAEKP